MVWLFLMSLISHTAYIQKKSIDGGMYGVDLFKTKNTMSPFIMLIYDVFPLLLSFWFPLFFLFVFVLGFLGSISYVLRSQAVSWASPFVTAG